MDYTHIQNSLGEVRKIVGVKDDKIVLQDEKTGKRSVIPRASFSEYYHKGEFKLGNVGDKGFVKYDLPQAPVIKKMVKAALAPYTTMAKEVSPRTVIQDALGTIGGHFGGHFVNYGIDNLMPSENSRMETGLGDAILGTALGFAGYKTLPSAAHRRIPLLPVADGEKNLKNKIQKVLTRGEAYEATHPGKGVTTQQELDIHNRKVANRRYKDNPAFDNKVARSLDDEFEHGIEKVKVGEVIDEGSGSRSTVKGSDKDIVRNEVNEGSQQKGGTKNTHTEIREQQPRKRDLAELFGGKPKEVPNDALNVNRIIDKEENFRESAQNSSKKGTEVKEHGSSSTDVNTGRLGTRTIYDYKPVVKDKEGHTLTDNREILRKLFSDESDEAKILRGSRSLNELHDNVVKVINDGNRNTVSKYEDALGELIAKHADGTGKVSQAQRNRADMLNVLDKMEMTGKIPSLDSDVSFTLVPRRGGTAADYIKSYGDSQNAGGRYGFGLGLMAGKQLIPLLNNKDDEAFSKGSPSGDEVFDEIRKSMNKDEKSSVEYVDPSNRKAKK